MAAPKQKVEKADGLEVGHIWYTEGGASHIEVVSIAPYPLLIPIHKKVGNTDIQTGVLKLMPGANVIPEDDWNAVRELELVKKRLDERWLQPGRLMKGHKYDLTETNKARMIVEHCAKAAHVKFDNDLELDANANLRALTQG